MARRLRERDRGKEQWHRVGTKRYGLQDPASVEHSSFAMLYMPRRPSHIHSIALNTLKARNNPAMCLHQILTCSGAQ